MSKKWIVLVLLMLVLGSFAVTRNLDVFPQNRQAASRIRTEKPELDPATLDLLQNFDAHVQESLLREQFPGAAVVVVKEGKVIFMKGYGVRSLYGRDSVNEHTVFRLASLSKGFASVLAGILVKEGQFQWDDPVSSYVRDFQLYKNQYTDSLTLRHVLSHTTGLPRQTYSNLIEAGRPYTEARSRLSEVRPTHRPGVHYNYQNVAYSLVGDVAERTTGKRFEDLLYSRIFLPLGMTNAGSGFTNFMLDTSNVAWPHRIEKQSYRRWAVLPNYYEVLPAAGVNASISDMGQWLLFLLGHKPEVLDKSTLDTLFNKQIAVPLAENNHRAFPESKEAWYGLGWRGVLSHGRQVIFHGGYVNGFRSEIAFVPSEDIGIAVLSNAPSWFINSSVPRFLAMYWGLPYEQN